MSEIYPIRGRNIGSTIATTSAFVNAFIAAKIYSNLLDWFSFPGVFAYYGFLCSMGCVFIYFFLPNTEGKTLEEVEELFENQFQRLKRKFFKN